jgi:hypothetical protein
MGKRCKCPPSDFPEIPVFKQTNHPKRKKLKPNKMKWIERFRVPLELPPLPKVHPSKVIRLNQ